MDKTHAIKEFLSTQKLCVPLYTPEMEVQVNVIPSANREGNKYIDKEYIYGPIRIPYGGSGLNASPTYTPTPLNWPLELYAEAIGLTGWNWFTRKSHWVGFDFDSIINHSKGLTDDELDDIRRQVRDIPWITLRRSTGGKGYHIYVEFENPVSTMNHTEHAALARAVLSQMSGVLNFNFADKVDGVGGVLWIWHRNACESKGSYKIIKPGIPLNSPPLNWRDHLVVTQFNKKSIDPLIKNDSHFQDLLTRIKRVKLDEGHRKLITWFANQATTWWWDEDHKMLVCHTYDLLKAYNELKLRGIFFTNSIGKDVPNDQNCFAFPFADGSWTVRRHSRNCSEHKYWGLDPSGWRKCYFNRLPDLETVCRIERGIKTGKGGFFFEEFEQAIEALGHLNIYIDKTECRKWLSRKTNITPGKSDGELIIKVHREKDDTFIFGWAPVAGPTWERVEQYTIERSPAVELPDDTIRYTVRGSIGSEWYIRAKDKWIQHGKDNVKSALITVGVSRKDIDQVLGQAIFDHWSIISAPFDVEYPGNRNWNKDAPQLSAKPYPGQHPSWTKIVDHIGAGFDEGVLENHWCINNNVCSGSHYLMLWIASLFKYPLEPLPYLFLTGDQDCGKSILHEALGLCFKNNVGYVSANSAITDDRGFNGELSNAVLCYIEELNLQSNIKSADRIKEWVTGKKIPIHPKGGQLYMIPNTTHWIHCANPPHYCPIFPGDTRISVAIVNKPTNIIPKNKLLSMLQEEVPAFLHTVFKTTIPETDGRLRIPSLKSGIKLNIEGFNESQVDIFIKSECEYAPGYAIKLSDFRDQFIKFMGPNESIHGNWSSRRIVKEIPLSQHPKGRYGNGGQIYIGNIRHKSLSDTVIGNHVLKTDMRGFLV